MTKSFACPVSHRGNPLKHSLDKGFKAPIYKTIVSVPVEERLFAYDKSIHRKQGVTIAIPVPTGFGYKQFNVYNY
jgi:hypothetical protein